MGKSTEETDAVLVDLRTGLTYLSKTASPLMVSPHLLDCSRMRLDKILTMKRSCGAGLAAQILLRKLL